MNWSKRSVSKSFPLPDPFLYVIWVLIGPGLLFSACSEKPLTRTSPEEARAVPLDSISELPQMGITRKAPFSFDMKLKAKTPEKNRRLKVSMRIRPDSILWGSVAPSFGIEVARILLTKDSLSFLDRMNDRYFHGEPGRMGDRFGIPLKFSLLESALLGKPALSHEKGYKVYKNSRDTLHYRPIVRQELKAYLGIGGTTDPYDTVNMDSPSIMRDSLDRMQAKEGGLRYLPFYWAADSGQVLTRLTVIDLQKRSVLELRYKAYQKLENERVPSEIRARVRSPKGISTFEIGISGVSGSDSLSYPFRVPDSYAPIHP